MTYELHKRVPVALLISVCLGACTSAGEITGKSDGTDLNKTVDKAGASGAGSGGSGGSDSAGSGGGDGAIAGAGGATAGTDGSISGTGGSSAAGAGGSEPMCLEGAAPCDDADQCCSGTCGESPLGQVCCGGRGDGCAAADGEECCGSLSCIEGTCGSPVEHVLDIEFEVQENNYWCGPAATRNALSAFIDELPSQAQLADELPTTTNGTDWIGQVTSVLNDYLGPDKYKTVEMPDDPPTQAQRDQLWEDVVYSIDAGYPLVTNIVAPPSNHPPGYPNETIYHYFVVAGYNTETHEVYIADSASFSGNTLYWLSFDQLATLIPPKGYSSKK